MKFLFLLLVCVQLNAQTTWKTFTCSIPDFTIDFPGLVQQKEKTINTDIGDIVLSTYYCTSSTDSTDNELYLVNFFRLDENIFIGDSSVSKTEYISNMVNNIGEDLRAREIYRNIDSDIDSPIITYRFENDKEQKSFKGKITIRKDYVYSLQVFTRKQYSLNKNMDRFLNSFYLK